MAEQVTFTPSDAQRISNAVIAHEKASKAVPEQNLDYGSSEPISVIVGVTGSKVNGYYPGIIYAFDSEVVDNQQTTEDERYRGLSSCWIREVNDRNLTEAKYLGITYGTKTLSGVCKTLVICNNAFSGTATGSIEVVTDVICTPTGLEVSTATLAGADYDSAFVTKFLNLSDVIPKSFLANQGRVVKVNDAGTGLEFGPIVDPALNYTTFISLSDTPSTYGTGNEYKVCAVDSSGAKITFTNPDVKTGYSITGGGNPASPFFVDIKLVNDISSPAKNNFYGTNSNGSRGWRTIELNTLSNWPNMKGKADCFVRIDNTENTVYFESININQILSDIANLKSQVESLETRVTTLESA